MVLGLLLRSASSSTTSTSASPALAAAAAPCGLEAKRVAHHDGTSLRAPADSRPRPGGGDAQNEEELDWELVEALPAESTTGPLSVDDYLVVESTSGGATPREESPRGLAASTSWQSHSEEADVAKSKKDEGAQEPPVTPVSSRPPSVGSAAVAVAVKAELGHDDAEREPPRPVEEPELSYRCRGCGMHIFKACEIISSNYNAQTSPGYLLSIAHNIRISSEVQQAVYTTGTYDIQEVSCQHCAKVLGVTYSGASDAHNKYKIGKFLVGSDRLTLPDGVVHPMTESKA